MTESITYAPAAVKPSGWFKVFAAVVVLIMLFPMWLGIRTVWGIGTMRYELTPTDLVITYGPATTRIARTEITDVRVLTPTRGIRRFGTGLPGLQEGRWSFQETGPIFMYSTTTRDLVVLETAQGKWGISPADRAGFQAALASGKTGVWEPVSAAHGAGPGLLMFVSLVLPLGVAALMIYLLRVPGTISYTLGSDALEIRLGFSRVRVLYSSLVDAEFTTPPGTPWKTWGAGLPGLYWGGFSWSKVGPNLRLYATQYKPLVVIRTQRYTYGISPDDAEGFVAELRRRISRT